MHGVGEWEACPARERDACGLLGSSPPSFSTALTLTEPTLATVNSHVGWIAFSSVPHTFLRISLQSTAIMHLSCCLVGAHERNLGHLFSFWAKQHKPQVVQPISPAVAVLKANCSGMVGSMSTRCRVIPKPATVDLPASSIT